MRPFSLVIRADEQEKLDSNSTVIVNGRNVTRELDINFYLGIYGGNLKTPARLLSALAARRAVWN